MSCRLHQALRCAQRLDNSRGGTRRWNAWRAQLGRVCAEAQAPDTMGHRRAHPGRTPGPLGTTSAGARRRQSVRAVAAAERRIPETERCLAADTPAVGKLSDRRSPVSAWESFPNQAGSRSRPSYHLRREKAIETWRAAPTIPGKVDKNESLGKLPGKAGTSPRSGTITFGGSVQSPKVPGTIAEGRNGRYKQGRHKRPSYARSSPSQGRRPCL